MKRKLIEFDAFNRLHEKSMSKAEKELIAAENVLADTLGKQNVNLYSFDESKVTYESNGNYIYATYKLKGNNLLFENIEELVVDEESAEKHAYKLVSNLLEEIINGNNEKADKLFSQFISLPINRRKFAEQKEENEEDKPLPLMKGKKKGKDKFKEFKDKFKKTKGKKLKADKKDLKEWRNISQTVLGYLYQKENGPLLEQAEVKADDKGNVVAIRMPDNKTRNEGKILSFNWKTLGTELNIMRNKVKTETRNAAFCQAVDKLREANALSDLNKTDMAIEDIVVRWPNLIFLNQTELANKIAESLDMMGENNYDDKICNFLAEGLLRKAIEVYEDKAEKVLRLSGVQLTNKPEDFYEMFQNVTHQFYPKLDENCQSEAQVFVDLYNTLVDVHKTALKERNSSVASDTNEYLKELHAVLNQEIPGDMDLAGEVASFIANLTETNLNSQDWSVSNTPYVTTNGDNPVLATYAKKGYTPASDFSGDWGDTAPVSDGKSYKNNLANDMRNHAFGNWEKNTWPEVNNPYVPDASEFHMKEPNAATDKTDSWGYWQGNDKTWPSLSNPNIPDAETPKSYKMKNDNLVVDQ